MNYYRLKPVFITLDETPSTNSFATDLIKTRQVENGTSIIARSQTSGKGQRGNQWNSAPWQNLTCSVIYYPRLDTNKMFYLNIITSLAAADILEKITARKVQIKWPNDLLINGKKIAGILIENQLKADKIQSTVIGIGINVNQTEFSSELNATSVKLQTGNSYDLDDVMSEFHRRLDHYINNLEEKAFDLLKEKYYQRLYGM
ncbi:MAG: biotin--[acetyl-CoA-carboxylase] ligase, partial [Crocinitomicaceae bacterium]|nr:biotin--[acetyl-CoA-carboxylase] ligase [Crocinitomicaceae bacterium]